MVVDLGDVSCSFKNENWILAWSPEVCLHVLWKHGPTSK